MATEKRLIDAYSLIGRALEEKQFVFQKEDLMNEQYIVNTVYRDLGEFIMSSPVVDAVEVVRCKDCRWWHDFTCTNTNGVNSVVINGEWFCCAGERKDNGV